MKIHQTFRLDKNLVAAVKKIVRHDSRRGSGYMNVSVFYAKAVKELLSREKNKL